MTLKKALPNKDALNKIVTEARRNQELREQSYRGQALKLYPWLCGRCAREFTHTNLTELTVHHKNHNHDDNPTDGSNWELLCLYCHDNEHSRYEETRCLASTILSGSRQLPWPVFVEKWATFLNSVFFDNCLLRFQ